MSNGKTNPPKRAIWFLRHACPGDNEALAGDLIERFREGQTRRWFWRQVFIAFILSVLGEIGGNTLDHPSLAELRHLLRGISIRSLTQQRDDAT